MSDRDHWNRPTDGVANVDADSSVNVDAVVDVPADSNADANATSRDSSYWQGTYQTPAYVQSPVQGAPAGGSVSTAARRSYANEAMRQKDHVAAGLLAIFLGLFGMHKFYLGCNNAGFIMLAVSIIGGIVTFGLAAAVIWLIAVIEGVIYLTKSQSDFDRLYVLNRRDWF